MKLDIKKNTIFFSNKGSHPIAFLSFIQTIPHGQLPQSRFYLIKIERNNSSLQNEIIIDFFLNIDISIMEMFQTERNDSDFSHYYRCEIGLSIVRKQFEIFSGLHCLSLHHCKLST